MTESAFEPSSLVPPNGGGDETGSSSFTVAELGIDFDTLGAHVDILTEPDPVQLEKRGVTSHIRSLQKRLPKSHSQGSLFKSGLLHKDSVAAKLFEAGYLDIAMELEKCHSETLHVRCDGCRKSVTVQNRCDRFYCPACTPRLAHERKESVEWWAKRVKRPWHVVLTVRNIPDLTKGHVQELKRWWSRLIRRKFCRMWAGGFYRIEVTNEGRGWHLHLHALVDAPYIHNISLALEWAKVNGGMGYITHAKQVTGSGYLAEVTKYAVKPAQLAGWSAIETMTFINAFKGLRTFGVFGSLFGARAEWREFLEAQGMERTRCSCGCNSYTCYSSAEWEFVTANLVPDVMKSLPPPPCDMQLCLPGIQLTYQFPK